MKSVNYLIIIILAGFVIIGAWLFTQEKHNNHSLFGWHLIKGTWFIQSSKGGRLTFMTFDDQGNLEVKKGKHRYKGRYSLTGDRQRINTDYGNIEITGINPKSHKIYSNEENYTTDCYRVNFESTSGRKISAEMCPFQKSVKEVNNGVSG